MNLAKVPLFLLPLLRVSHNTVFFINKCTLIEAVIYGYLNSSESYVMSPANPSSLVTFTPRVSASFQLDLTTPVVGEIMLSFFLNISATHNIIRGSINFTVIPGILIVSSFVFQYNITNLVQVILCLCW